MRDYLLKSLNIKEKHFGAKHQELCLTLANLATAYVSLHQVDLAKTYCQRAVGACCLPVANNRRCGVVLLRAAALHIAVGEECTAREYLLRSAETLTKALDE